MANSGPSPSQNARQSNLSANRVVPSVKFYQYQKEKAERHNFQLRMQAFAAVFGSFFYGLLTAVCSFAMGFFTSSALGKGIGHLLFGYAVTVTKALIPTALAPYSAFVLFSGPAAMILGSMYYAYRTNTHGFSKWDAASTAQAANYVAYALPFVSFFIGRAFDLSPIGAFNLAWGMGMASGVYLSSDAITRWMFSPSMNILQTPTDAPSGKPVPVTHDPSVQRPGSSLVNTSGQPPEASNDDPTVRQEPNSAHEEQEQAIARQLGTQPSGQPLLFNPKHTQGTQQRPEPSNQTPTPNASNSAKNKFH